MSLRNFRIESIVSGYIHKFESDELFVPADIKGVCSAFYAILDYFDQTCHETAINDTLSVIECHAVDGEDAFGKILVQPEYNIIHRWTFKIVSTCDEVFGIGLTNKDNQASYFYCSDGTSVQSSNWESEKYAIKCKQDDIVEMILDNYALRFKINQQDQGYMLHYLPLASYKMVVSLSGSKEVATSIQLLFYSRENSK